jgi:hypothetical protein
MNTNEIRDALQRAFMAGYQCGRQDERQDANPPSDSRPFDMALLDEARDAAWTCEGVTR